MVRFIIHLLQVLTVAIMTFIVIVAMLRNEVNELFGYVLILNIVLLGVLTLADEMRGKNDKGN